MSASIKAIQTRYKGHLFRSRLEARWAVVLDALGVEWHYEAEGYDLGKDLGYYLPDFWLPELNTFLEIKAEEETTLEFVKLFNLANDKKAFHSFGYSLHGERNSGRHCRWEDTETWERTPWPKKFLDKHKANPQKLSDKRTLGKLVSLPNAKEGELYCPLCHSEKPPVGNYFMVHVEEPQIMTPYDDYPHPLLRVRGPVYRLEAWSEHCGHKWEYLFGFHKGQTLFGCSYEYEENYTPLQYLLYVDPSGQSAIDAGRTARFEHGASGAVS